MKRHPFFRAARHLLEYVAALPFFLIVPRLPRRWIGPLGRGLGLLGYHLIGRRRRIALANLELAYGPAMTASEREALARQVFIHFATAALDFLWASRLTAQSIGELVEIDAEGLSLLKKALDKGRGVLLLFFHMGHWELCPVVHGYRGIGQLHGVARRLDNPYLDWKINAVRLRSGTKVIYKDRAASSILRALKGNEIIGIGLDQNTSRGHVFVNFFGHPAATSKSIATFALATGAPILAAVCLPIPDGRYRVYYGPEIDYQETGDREKDIVELTQRCTSVIEEQIRKTPQYWLWLHQRWKHQPP
jgi:Kdo2-lipid IVA lauroyltransferase/acyltransferase